VSVADGLRADAPTGAARLLRLQREAGNTAVRRMLARSSGGKRRTPPGGPPRRPPRPPGLPRIPGRKGPYSVMPGRGERDELLNFWDPDLKRFRRVWTVARGYTKNPSAKHLVDVISSESGLIEGGFRYGTFPFAVDVDRNFVIGRAQLQPDELLAELPQPMLVAGKRDERVWAVGTVTIRAGQIDSMNDLETHYDAPRESLRDAIKSAVGAVEEAAKRDRVPARERLARAFAPRFRVAAVNDFDELHNPVLKPFLTLEALKIKGRNLSDALRGLKPRLDSGRWGRSFGAFAKSAGRAFAGALIELAVQIIAAQVTQEIEERWVNDQIDALAPAIEQRLTEPEQHEELEELLLDDSEADIYMHVCFQISSHEVFAKEGQPAPLSTLPLVKLYSVAYSRRMKYPTPRDRTEINCGTPTNYTYVTVTQVVEPGDFFRDEPPGGPERIEQ
jgi:hypothetical protein